MTESIDPKNFNTTGHNFGKYDFGENHLVIKNLDSKTPIMQVPYSNISISNASGKNEVAIEFAQPDRKEGHRIKGDILAEIRFFVQNNEVENRE